ncbi:hypothetical protein QT06_C0001G0611 [archaeon GW2011_AR15]|nr:hypothetical protein QT06_C0001G0611 [archaeon GW2011_AR15]MBS3103922.1 glycosyltransferase family 39 protein [Candidatus Woesearchaeota archaeon]
MFFKTILKKISKHKIVLFLILLNLTLNLIGINFGLPDTWHPDELTHSVTRMLSEKTLNPGRFTYPSFYHYVLIAANIPYSAFLLLSGKAAMLATDSVLRQQTIAIIFLTSRIVTAFFGSILVFLIYIIAKKVSNERAAIISAAFASLNMAIITYSHFATSDMPVTVMSMLSIYMILRLYEKPIRMNYILTGLAIGLATGTKYYAVVLVLLLIGAHLLATKKVSINKNLIISGMLCAVGFLITTPFAILDFNTFFRDTTLLFTTVQTVQNLYDPVTALSYFFHLDNGLGTPLFILSLIGTAYCVYLARKNNKLLLLLSWAIGYFLLVSYIIHFSFLRYILPVVPIIIIFAGVFFNYLLSFKRHRIITYSFLFAVLLFNFSYAIKTDMLFVKDSRYSSTEWIKENIPDNSNILIFAQNLRYFPDISSEKNVSYLNVTDFSSVESLREAIKKISPDYIIESSLYYNRYLYYTNMYPKRSPLQDLFGYVSHEPVATDFYRELINEKLGYSLIKKFPEEKEDVPDPEFINPTILIFKLNN